MSVTTSCPGCGAPLAFQYQSVVVVCGYCQSAVTRTDQSFESLGRVARITHSKSGLRLGLEGSYEQQKFVLCGHTRLQHPAGGHWDEWYAAFEAGYFGWLAEAQGRFILSFQHPAPDEIPPYEAIEVGSHIVLPSPYQQPPLAFTVNEKSAAEQITAEGELPTPLRLGERYRYIDLSGPNNEFATLDYRHGPIPTLYVGTEVSLKSLGIQPDPEDAAQVPRDVGAQRLACPNCDGTVELRVPDSAQRMVCVYCNAFLDIDQGNLRFLKTLSKSYRDPELPLGASGNLDDCYFTIIGYLQRSAIFDGISSSWDEYLLYNPGVGYRWLVKAEDEWHFLFPVSSGRVSVQGKLAMYNGDTFFPEEEYQARVDYVLGELYWRVEIGETVRITDYRQGTRTLSREATDTEENWSFGRRFSAHNIGAAFGVTLAEGTPVLAPYDSSDNIKSNDQNAASILLTIFVIFIILLFAICADEDDGCSGSGSGSSYGGSYSSGGGFRSGK